MEYQKLVALFIRNPDSFGNTLKETIKKQGYSLRDFSKLSKVPENTLYKITHDKNRDFKVSTLRNILMTIQKLQGIDEPFIAIITSRTVLDRIKMKDVKIKDKIIPVKEYPASTIEEVLLTAIRAERDGALGIVCGPIAATNVEKIVTVPVAAILLDEAGVKHALEILKFKL